MRLHDRLTSTVTQERGSGGQAHALRERPDLVVRVRGAIAHDLEALGGKILAPVMFKRSAGVGALVPDAQALAIEHLDLDEVVSRGRLRGLSCSDHGDKDCRCGGDGHYRPSQAPYLQARALHLSAARFIAGRAPQAWHKVMPTTPPPGGRWIG